MLLQNNHMLDIETMSTNNSNALILSVGLVTFDLTETGPAFSAQRLWLTDLAEQLYLGREVTTGTQKWWAKQSAAAADHWLRPNHETGERLTAAQLIEAIRSAIKPKEWVWANGIVFDCGNIVGLADQIGVSHPWEYNQVQDYRTMVRQLNTIRPSSHEPGTAHDPVKDCINQIWNLWSVYPRNN